MPLPYCTWSIKQLLSSKRLNRTADIVSHPATYDLFVPRPSWKKKLRPCQVLVRVNFTHETGVGVLDRVSSHASFANSLLVENDTDVCAEA